MKGVSVDVVQAYELNRDDYAEAVDDGSLEESSYALQFACSLLIDSVDKTMNFCPNEFKKVFLSTFGFLSILFCDCFTNH